MAYSCPISPLILDAAPGDGHNVLPGGRAGRSKDKEEAPGGGSGSLGPHAPGCRCHSQPACTAPVPVLEDLASALAAPSCKCLKHTETQRA